MLGLLGGAKERFPFRRSRLTRRQIPDVPHANNHEDEREFSQQGAVDRLFGHEADKTQSDVLRTRLYRASKILQDVFFMWRKICWTADIVRVEQEGSVLLFDLREDLRNGPFFEFPRHLLATEAECNTLLSYCACVEAQKYFVQLTQKLFADITTNIESVYINVAPGSYTIYERGDDSHYTHHVLAVDTPDQNTYIVDLSGRQLGLDTPIMPLEEYFAKFTASVRSVHHHKYTFATFKDALGDWDGGKWASRISGTQWKVYEGLNRATEQWEKDGRCTVAEMLSMPNKKYKQQARSLMTALERGCRTAFSARAALGHPRTTPRSLGVETTPEEKSLLKKHTLSLDPSEGELSGIRRQWLEDRKGGS